MSLGDVSILYFTQHRLPLVCLHQDRLNANNDNILKQIRAHGCELTIRLVVIIFLHKQQQQPHCFVEGYDIVIINATI